MKILITGASGRLGREIVKFLQEHYELVALTRTPFPTLRGVTSYVVDLAHPTQFSKIVASEKPDAIIHLAAILGPVCESNPVLTEKINVEATKQLAELASQHGVKKFVFASTSAVYNQAELSPTNESDNIDPQSTYGKSKLKAEEILQDLSLNSSTQFITLRIFNIYGAGFEDSLVYKLIHSTPDRPIMLLGLDTYYRDYIHIDDVVKVFKSCIEGAQEDKYLVMNIGSGKAVSNRDLVDALVKNGLSPSYASSQSTLSVSWANIAKAKKEIGFNPAIGIIIDR